jgi:hypothetical protein
LNIVQYFGFSSHAPDDILLTAVWQWQMLWFDERNTINCNGRVVTNWVFDFIPSTDTELSRPIGNKTMGSNVRCR